MEFPLDIQDRHVVGSQCYVGIGQGDLYRTLLDIDNEDGCSLAHTIAHLESNLNTFFPKESRKQKVGSFDHIGIDLCFNVKGDLIRMRYRDALEGAFGK